MEDSVKGRLITDSSSIFVIHDGTERDKNIMEQLSTHLERRTRKAINLISARSDEAKELIRKHHLRGSHFVLIVKGNGELHHMWTDGDQFDAPYIANMAEQIH